MTPPPSGHNFYTIHPPNLSQGNCETAVDTRYENVSQYLGGGANYFWDSTDLTTTGARDCEASLLVSNDDIVQFD